MRVFVIQIKDVFGQWRDEMGYATIENAVKAWPLWRKGTKRDIRCVERTETVVDISAVLAAHLKGGK